MKDSGILEIEIKYMKTHVRERISQEYKPSPKSGTVTRVQSLFIQPAFHQLHARREALLPFSLILSYLPFRALTSPYNIATHDCFPSTHKVLPSPSTCFITDAHTHKCARGEIDVKDKEGGNAQGQGVKREICLLRFTDARA